MEDVAAMYKGNGPDDENDPDPFHLAKRTYDLIHSGCAYVGPKLNSQVCA